MPQIVSLSLDVMQPSEKKGESSFLSTKASDGSAFSSLVEEHMNKSGNKDKVHGNVSTEEQINNGKRRSDKAEPLAEEANNKSSRLKSEDVFLDEPSSNVSVDEQSEFAQASIDNSFDASGVDKKATDKMTSEQPALEVNAQPAETEVSKNDSQRLLNFLAASDEVLADKLPTSKAPNKTEDIKSSNKISATKGNLSNSLLANHVVESENSSIKKSKNGQVTLNVLEQSKVQNKQIEVIKENSPQLQKTHLNENVSQANHQLIPKDTNIKKTSSNQFIVNDTSVNALKSDENGFENSNENSSTKESLSLKELLKQAELTKEQGLNDKNYKKEESIKVSNTSSAFDTVSSEETKVNLKEIEQSSSLKAKTSNEQVSDSTKNANKSSLTHELHSTLENRQEKRTILDEKPSSVAENKLSENVKNVLKANDTVSSAVKEPLSAKSIHITDERINTEIKKEFIEKGLIEKEQIAKETLVSDPLLDNEKSSSLSNVFNKNTVVETLHNTSSIISSSRGDVDPLGIDESIHAQEVEQLVTKTVKDNQQIQKNIAVSDTIAIYKKEFATEMKDKVMVMINQKLQQVDIQLDPPELGNVHVRVNLQNEQASVSFIVQNQQAKEALEQHMGKLRDMLGESGVDVGDSNVAQQDQSSNDENQEGQFGQDNQGTSHDDLEVTTLHAEMVKASAVGVDFYA